jgi:hypothetical protein
VITRVPSWSTRENDEMSEKAMSNLQDRLDEFGKAFESEAPPYNAPHEAIGRPRPVSASVKAVPAITDKPGRFGTSAGRVN